MSETPLITMRLNPDLAAWAKKYAQDQGIDRTSLITEFLVALRERRVVYLSTSTSHVIQTGNGADDPVQVCLNPQ